MDPMTTSAQVNPHSGVPLWRQIADAIEHEIRSGELAIGDPVQGYRDLATVWSVGPSTAMSALAHLRRQGLISNDRGQASKVLRTPHVVRVAGERYVHGDQRSPVAADFDRGGHSIALRGSASTEPASKAVARRLKITEGDVVSRIDYCWSDESGPTQRSTQWEPLAITKRTSAEVPPESGEPNVIDRMARIGQFVTYVRERYFSRMPTTAESEELQLGEGVPVMFIERTHLADQIPVETADIAIRGDRAIVEMQHTVRELAT